MFEDNKWRMTASEFEKIIGKSGNIHFQTEIDYVLNIQKYVSIEVGDVYDDGEPMMYKLSFINEAGNEDVLEFWESSILNIDLEKPEDWEDGRVKFLLSFVYDADSFKYIEFYYED